MSCSIISEVSNLESRLEGRPRRGAFCRHWSREYQFSNKAKSFTIDGEAVVLGPDGLSRFAELRRREGARTAVLYAFDLIDHDGEDLRDRPFLDRKAARARPLHDRGGNPDQRTHRRRRLYRLRTRLPVRRRASSPRSPTAPIDPVRAWFGSWSVIQRASRYSGSAARIGTSDYRLWPSNEPIAQERAAVAGVGFWREGSKNPSPGPL